MLLMNPARQAVDDDYVRQRRVISTNSDIIFYFCDF